MIKRIVVPTDGSASAEVGARYAIALAKKYDARLLGVHVVDVKLLEGPFLRDLSASLGTAPYVNYQGNITMILEERGNAALESFKKACEEAGVQCETALATGVVPRTIVEQADLADLIVMGRGGEHNDWLEGLLGSTAEAVIRRAPLPVLVTGVDTPGDRRFLVAYDGSQHARRGLKTGVTIAEEWKMPMTLLVVGGDSADETLDEARGYLQAHQIEVNYERRSGDPGEAIVKAADECEADLIVMGAYGHSKVRDLVVGSTTTYVLNHANTPVLLAK